MTDATDDRTQPRYGELVPGEPAQEPTQEQAAAAPAEASAATPAADADAPSAAAYPSAESLAPGGPLTQQERVGRGLALALVIIPAGVIAWTILWNIGFIASIVSWGVAAGAVWLYRAGSKARVTRGAFWGLVAIVVVTVVLSLLAGIFSDLVSAVGIPLTQALTDPDFWGLFADNIFNNGELWQAYLPQVVLALAFAFLGCFWTMRRLARESRA
ncbi:MULTISPECIES: hypothetical protein [unclassified Leifsonia]|uniref:hypothetical protein n=1 Tax=unclassified Leifsonia TaxID=2663824 RepID=UPI0003813AC7|nr:MULTISPECIES: hypothetical protein [unclassified Leifsonia]TDP99375.1 hypothetical protein AXZ95_3293 [Leifsonia sp. 115AMFTsu3.1]